MSSASYLRKPSSSKEGKGAEPENFGQLLSRLGDIPPERVRLSPPPGQASKRDLLRLLEHDNILCELVDGTLVEKAVGQIESLLGGWLIHCLWAYLEKRNIGRVFGADAPHQLKPRLIRMPDVAFVSFDRLPHGEARKKSIANWVPELVVEILSKSNAKKEIERKLVEYFTAGVVLVWVVDPRKRTVKVHTDEGQFVTLNENDRLDGGEVLSGFTMSIRDWFAKMD